MKWLEHWRSRAAAPDGAAILFALCLLAATLAALSLTLVSAVALQQIRASTTVERVAQATAAARAVRADLDRALGFGIPLAEMQGLREYLEARMARQPDLHFFALVNARGERVHAVGIDNEHLDRLLQQPGATDGSKSGAPGSLGALGVGDDLIVREYLRAGGGAVLAAVRTDEMTTALTRDVWGKWPFWMACLLLAIAWAASAARLGVIEPLGRLAAAMHDAITQGRFFTLLVRRDRDAVGSCLFSFNAVVAGLHAHWQGFVAQAETVRHAVFDPAVAEQVEELRDLTLKNIGDGLATPPARIIDARASDADVFAISLTAAGAMKLTSIMLASLSALVLLVAAVGMAGGALLGLRFGNRRWLTVPSAIALLLLALLGMSHSSLLDHLSALVVLVSAGALALAGAVALAQRRAARRAGGVSSGYWTVLLGGLSGVALASVVTGDVLTIGVCLVLLATAATLAAIFSRQG